jgi:hypothetical protein
VRGGLAMTAIGPYAVRHHPLSKRLDANPQTMTFSELPVLRSCCAAVLQAGHAAPRAIGAS